MTSRETGLIKVLNFTHAEGAETHSLRRRFPLTESSDNVSPLLHNPTAVANKTHGSAEEQSK
jgi:hypothetical protein